MKSLLICQNFKLSFAARQMCKLTTFLTHQVHRKCDVVLCCYSFVVYETNVTQRRTKLTKFRLYEESGVFITHHLNVSTLSNVSESTLVHFSCWQRETHTVWDQRRVRNVQHSPIKYNLYCFFLNPVFCTRGHFVSVTALCPHHPCHAHLLYSTITFTCCAVCSPPSELCQHLRPLTC